MTDEYLLGLQDAAGAMCGHCFRGVPVRMMADGTYQHVQSERDGKTRFYGCNSTSIISLMGDRADAIPIEG